MTALRYSPDNPFTGRPKSAEELADADIDHLIDGDLSYFREKGCLDMLRSMLKQSIKDLLVHRTDPHAPAELSTSANWPKTEGGMRVIEFLMPSVSPDRAVARIYEDPARVLAGFVAAEKEAEADDKDADPDAPDAADAAGAAKPANPAPTPAPVRSRAERSSDAGASAAWPVFSLVDGVGEQIEAARLAETVSTDSSGLDYGERF